MFHLKYLTAHLFTDFFYYSISRGHRRTGKFLQNTQRRMIFKRFLQLIGGFECFGTSSQCFTVIRVNAQSRRAIFNYVFI